MFLYIQCFVIFTAEVHTPFITSIAKYLILSDVITNRIYKIIIFQLFVADR